MAQTVVIAGAMFQDVPAISVPDSSNVYHAFTDVSDTTAAASDVAQGKYFYTAGGVRTAGTSSGGGSVLIHKNITANGRYSASSDNVDGYSSVQVDVPQQGIVIPQGFAYYNGYLLPKIPEISGRQYAWIRDNDQNDTYDLVLGTGVWYTKSGSATLDNWQLMFNNYATDLSYQYYIPRDGTATSWGEYITSSNYYGTANNRKVIWSSHDIKIASAGGNVLYRHGIALEAAQLYAVYNLFPSDVTVDKSEAVEGETVTVTGTASTWYSITVTENE